MLTRPRVAFLPFLAALCMVAWGAAEALAQSQFPFGLLIAQQSRPSFAVLGAGARPAGVGNAFTALADDAAAASFNPAGLALLVEPELSLVGNSRKLAVSHTAFAGVSENGVAELYTDTRDSFAANSLSFAALTLPFTVRSRNLTVQAAFQRVVDFRESLERSFAESLGQDPTPVETYRHAYDQTGGVTTYSLAAAYQLTDRLSVGRAGVRWLGRWRFSSLASEKPYPQGEEVPS